MKSFKVLGVTHGQSKAGKPYTSLSLAEEKEGWEGVHAFTAFLKGEAADLKPGKDVRGIITYYQGSASLNV